MNWNPKYTITNHLLSVIREIGEAVGEIKAVQFSKHDLAELEFKAREISTYASTSIEGNPLALTDVKQLLKSKKERIRDTEREVLNYNKALQKIYKDVSDKNFTLNLKTIEAVQKQVTTGLLDNPAHIGSTRNDAVIIRDPRKIDEVVFIPPDAKDVKPLMQDLLTFINQSANQIDPIVLAGLFHRQCVIIHPFMDGNGRTTRLITSAILGLSGLDLFKIFSFENYYNQNVTKYFKAVGLTGDYYDLQNNVDHTTWLEYFAEGILDELVRVRKTLKSLQKPLRLENHHRNILDYIDEHGSITQREYADISTRSLAARKQDFERLLELNLIDKEGSGRGTYYVAVKGF